MASTVSRNRQALGRWWKSTDASIDSEHEAEEALVEREELDRWLEDAYGESVIVDTFSEAGKRELTVRVFGDLGASEDFEVDLKPGESIGERWVGQVLDVRGTEFDVRLVLAGSGPGDREFGHTFDVLEIPLDQRSSLRAGAVLHMVKILDQRGSHRWMTNVRRARSLGISSAEAKKFAAWVRERQVDAFPDDDL